MSRKYSWGKSVNPSNRPAYQLLGCPACSAPGSGVYDSRVAISDGSPYVRRRRKCDACGHRWSTAEIPVEQFEALLSIAEEQFNAMWRAAKNQLGKGEAA
jgi:transcriptional regulator NrdR family protein